jgi:hypothetical protein
MCTCGVMVEPLRGAFSGPWQFHISSYEVMEFLSLLPGLKEGSVKDSKFHGVKSLLGYDAV